MTVYIYTRDFIAHHTRPGGGLYKAVAGLAAGMVAAGTPVEILCEGDVELDEFSLAGYRVRCFRAGPRPGNFVIAPKLVEFISALPRPSLFAINGLFVPGNVMVSKLLRKLKQPYVVAPHDPLHPELFAKGWLKKKIFWALFERPMFRHADAIQVLDIRHVKYLVSRGVYTPGIEVPNGYADADVLPESALTFRDEGPMKFYFLGRVDAHNKGLDLLIDAFASLGKHVDAELTIQGPDWGDRDFLIDRAAALNMDGRVRVLPQDFTRTSPELIDQHDVICMPSRFEGFGLTAMEGMLNARPVMVSDIAGLSQHVRAADGGVVVQPNVDSIRKGLIELINRRAEWREIGMRSRAYALERFRWDRIGVDAIAQYRTLMPKDASNRGAARSTSTTTLLSLQ